MNDNQDISPDSSAESPEAATDGKVIKKTFEEIREEARREILSSVDRDKFEHLEPDEREFIDQVCLFEMNSQKVARQHKKIKLREIMLCRDVAQAYCPGKDLMGQYSEGKRILKNSETGSDSVKFVLARKVCSMLDKISNIYQSNAASFVRADLHKLETDLLNYIYRLGRMIREPLNEAKRVYTKLKDRAGWSLPPQAFDMVEDCDVPQLFFNRYSSRAQLLLKDPEKPFRSDNNSPPLKLDFRIKNAVLIVSGENQFHLDKGRHDRVRETSAAKFISAKSLQEGKGNITKAYERDLHKLENRLSLTDDLSVESIKENAFAFFYNYTLKNLPSTASCADTAELFIQELMKEENDIGCLGFCLNIYPPEAVQDESEPGSWQLEQTGAYKLRKVFNDVATGKIRLSVFPTRMNQLLSEYLEGELLELKRQIDMSFSGRVRGAKLKLKKLLMAQGSPLEQEQQDLEEIEKITAEAGNSGKEAFSLMGEILKNPPGAKTLEQKKEVLGRMTPKMIEEVDKNRHAVEELGKKYEWLMNRKKSLDAKAGVALKLSKRLSDNSSDEQALEMEKKLIVSLTGGKEGGTQTISTDAVVELVGKRQGTVKEAMEKIKKQFDQRSALQDKMKKVISLTEDMDSRQGEIARLREKLEAGGELRRQEETLREELKQVNLEYGEKLGPIEEAIEVNRET
ncbi:MAG: hypothetical protein U9P14_00765 [Gemmatimonadota bacterium]|nr:hypothetical protein [Gemmatimonadota bacterium]